MELHYYYYYHYLYVYPQKEYHNNITTYDFKDSSQLMAYNVLKNGIVICSNVVVVVGAAKLLNRKETIK